MPDNPMIKLTGLWKIEKPDGTSYYRGKLGPAAQVLIFKNKFKSKDTDPDLILYLAKLEKRDAPGKADDDAF